MTLIENCVTNTRLRNARASVTERGVVQSDICWIFLLSLLRHNQPHLGIPKRYRSLRRTDPQIPVALRTRIPNRP